MSNTMKAVALMAVWTAVFLYGMQMLDVGAHHRDPLWAVGSAAGLLVMWVVNFAIFFKVAGSEPWDWFKGSH